MWWLERYLTEGSARLPRCDGGRSEAVEPRVGRSLTTIPNASSLRIEERELEAGGRN